MIVYIACPSAELERARRAMDAVRASGLEVAHDWVAQIDAIPGDPNRDIPPGPARALSLTAFRHLKRAGMLWLLFPEAETIGTWIETGGWLMASMQLAGARFIVSGGDVRRSIFLNGNAFRVFETDDDAIAWLQAPGSEGAWLRSATRPA